MAENLPNLDIRYSRRRRTIGIEVREGRVVVRAPSGFPAAQLHRLVARKARWIDTKLRQQQDRMRERPQYSYREGERFPYLGQTYPLTVVRGPRADCDLKDGELRVSLGPRSRQSPEMQIYNTLKSWYRRQAGVLLSRKTQELCRQHGLKMGKVTVRATRSKWGHCTNRGDIQYNWQILLAPEPVVDYLVAHEVSHLVHHNHSPAFWRHVERLFPGHKPHRQWLKEQGHTLILPGNER
ncbi:M48 family metallopeptidase [Gilvimarinus xylanilyticus]|uniref:M48 family metallopeptidase n=1 Tax=Gilvimarinus xylanilyticus TaxID=2944139 RepID=A0A9X2KVA6_9GAMM|nr:SprT family zinc-dependent metalloprotease [Gilvimarinus xylanilyticus]MCP8900748.1 M48 family metallopeptidase [Gilvimarinus xylanilyticus]